MAEKEKYVSESLMKDRPTKALGLVIKDKSIITPKLAENAVTTQKVRDKAITPQKLSDSVKDDVIAPMVNTLDSKYKSITDELYNMIASLQVGGIALSNELGDRTDIGITQKALTKAIGKIWEAIEDPSHHVFDFTLTVNPINTFTEDTVEIEITADCSMAISDFDRIKIYVDDILVDEATDIRVFTTTQTVDKTSTVKAVGSILGQYITKEAPVYVRPPFFIGSGLAYEDIINMEYWYEIEGTLEGNYDMRVTNDNDYIFIVIPLSRKDEFRRADMNGYEIPLNIDTQTDECVVYKSVNRYKAGSYNIDIDINS